MMLLVVVVVVSVRWLKCLFHSFYIRAKRVFVVVVLITTREQEMSRTNRDVPRPENVFRITNLTDFA